ncbi:hypothetical protein [Nocardiopsis sp. CC223A]|nr:hypothetical protein [Nocardiopsis sp. CC223A]
MIGTVIGLAALALVFALVAVLLALTGGPHLMTQTRTRQKETT